MAYGYIIDHDHPLSSGSGKVGKGRAALYAKIGNGPHSCVTCGNSVTWRKGRGLQGLIVKYLDGSRENLDPSNLEPSCVACILSGTNAYSIKPGETVFVNKDGRRERGLVKICAACDREFIVGAANAKANPKVGTYCSGSCRSRHSNKLRWAKIKQG